MSQWQRLSELEQRDIMDALGFSAVIMAEAGEDSEASSDELDDLENNLIACSHAMIYRTPEDTTMDVNLRLLDLGRLDGRYDDEFLVENFRFRREHIVIFMQHLRLPDHLRSASSGDMGRTWRCGQ